MTASPPTVSRPARVAAAKASVASAVPLQLGLLSLILSVILAVWTFSTTATQPPFAELGTWPLSVAGYVLTPVLTIGALTWDRVAQRRGLRDRNFALRPAYATGLRYIVGFSFLPAVWHIANIANLFAGGF
tara:strand:- start:88 stop:480 length:393 start_codon:yes stop_codon:yes gene_type:complete